MTSKVEGAANLSIDKKFVFNIKAKDLKVLAVYCSDPSGYLSLIGTNDYTKAIFQLFQYADSSFIDNMGPFIDSGTLDCQIFFDRINEMDIEDAYPKIKADLSQKGLINGSESLIILNTGFAKASDIASLLGSYIMLIGVMVIADKKSTVNVVSAENIQENKVKFNLNGGDSTPRPASPQKKFSTVDVEQSAYSRTTPCAIGAWQRPWTDLASLFS